MANRIIKQVANILEQRNIPYETNHITFQKGGVMYVISREKAEQSVYQLEYVDTKNNYRFRQSYPRARINQMFRELITKLDEGSEHDDSND